LVLVVGLGNPDRGDDGFGAKVVEALSGRLPPDVEVRTCRGDVLDLIDEWSGFDALVCVDAAAPMNWPGCVHRIDLSEEALPRELSFASSHAMGLAEAIELARTLGQAPRDIVVFAIEGVQFVAGGGLTPEVAAAVAPVAERVVAESVRLRSAGKEKDSHA
jgi:hydrogenase maturation protease